MTPSFRAQLSKVLDTLVLCGIYRLAAPFADVIKKTHAHSGEKVFSSSSFSSSWV